MTGLRVEPRGSVLVVTIDRPEARNALTWELIEALGDAFDRAGSDDVVRCLVLTGADGTFCAGGDVKDQARRREWRVGDFVGPAGRLAGAARSVYECPKPAVAAIAGAAMGAGVSFALMADVRIAERGARFGFAYGNVGLAPDFGLTWTLPRAVGPGTAARLLYTAARIDAEEAARIGLVDELVDEGKALDAALELAETIAAGAPLSVRFAKAGLRRANELSFAKAVEAEGMGMHIARQTDDHAEGLRAFGERRPPRFRGS